MKKKNIIFAIMNIVFLSCCSHVDDSSFLSEEPSSSQNEDISNSENSSFVIRFDPNGGNGTMNDQLVDCDEFILNKNTFTKPGYNFVGWSLQPNGFIDFADCEEIYQTITSDTTLYAIYEFASSKVDELIAEYSKQLDEKSKNVYAYYGGQNEHDITLYVKGFNPELSNMFELQFGKIVYVGNDPSMYELVTSNFIPISQSYRNAEEISLVDAYLELAYSYYYQGVQLQYDQGSSYQRKIRDMAPEDATQLFPKYLDCSTFVSNAFYNAFNEVVIKSSNINSITTKVLIDFAEKNINSSNEVILYKDNLSDLSENDKKDAIQEFKDTIQPGDLYVYRHTNDTAGHVMLYVGGGYFLHSTGSSYNYSSLVDRVENYTSVQGSEKPEGTVRFQSASSTVYNPSSTRYLFYTDTSGPDSNDRYALLRPLNRKGLSLSNATIARCMSSGIEIEKSADKTTSVSLNDKITYTISIKNNSKDYIKNVSICDVVPEYTSFIEMSKSYYYNNDRKNIMWNVPTIEPQGTIELTYSVSVNNEQTNIGKNISSHCFVNQIKSNTLNISISSFNDLDYKSFVDLALQYYNNPNVYYDSQSKNETLDPTKNIVTFNNGATFVTSLYKRFYELKGIEFNISNELTSITNSNFMNGIMNEDGVFDTSSLLYSMMVNGGYGGTAFTKDYYMDRMRTVEANYLLPGDIISFENTSATNQYLYLGDITIGSTTYKKAMLLFTTKDGVKLISGSDSDALLIKFIGYKRFAIIRPSLYR